MKCDFLVIGGGIVGLATARALVNNNPGAKVIVLEKEDGLARHQTGRNSGVIHSGIYYKPGSFKAEFCRKGRASLVEYFKAEGVPYDLCGKLIVATTPEELPLLENLRERGLQNGLAVERLTPEQARAIEPHVACLAALRVPETGITDYRQVCEKLAANVRNAGGEVHCGAPVDGIRAFQQNGRAQDERPQDGRAGLKEYSASSEKDRAMENRAEENRIDGAPSRSKSLLTKPAPSYRVQTQQGTFETRVLINCAGLHSDRVARMAGARPTARIVPFRGEYYELEKSRRGLVKHLIYPVPNPAFPFLGVHFTRMIDGSVHAGPNAVVALRREGYDWTAISPRDLAEVLGFPGFWRLALKNVREGTKEIVRSFSRHAFLHSLQRLIPELRAEDIEPSQAGVRAQALKPDGSMVDDFLIVKEGAAVHVLNAPSPAATCSLEIGEHVARQAVEVAGL